MASLLNNIAPAYNPTESYSFGAKTLNNDHLYQCIKPTTGTFDPDAWTEIYLSDLIQGGVSMDGLEPVLLWTNPNPSSAFANKKISLDLSEYDGVLIEFYRSSTSTGQYVCNTSYALKGTSSSGGGVATNFTSGTGRGFIVTDNGVEFKAGQAGDIENNQAIIPYKIYGVKKVVVETSIGELLWTNPNPSLSFAGQDISLPISSNDKLLIEFYLAATNQTIIIPAIYDNSIQTDATYGRGGISSQISSAGTFGRFFKKTSTGINISACNPLGGSGSNNNYLIPYKITRISY